ncbi:PQQ-binding-like beta-propeller repeat protein [uncultured Jatrophihabitans sp.]|uniref:outer membrane protein assembly factor BamB family protein n=1 Tax=uncultured Jatrophihabitans sp. TaxID=1610747 RepID=UPI0035C98A53
MTLPPPPAQPRAAAQPGAGDARAAASDAALDRHNARLRRSRLVYFVTVAVVVAALATFAAVAWSRGEAAHTTLRTVAHPPASIGPARPVAAPQQRWRSGDRLALGTPTTSGTVVTYSTHTVSGRNARTGAQTWSYTRTDRRVCNTIQLGATAVAVYALHGDCDEVTALDVGTGARDWTRTLDEDGVTLNGAASYRWKSDTLLIYSPDAMYAIDPSTGLDRWTYRRYGCHTNAAVIGAAGALISQNCPNPRCKGVKLCARGQQLVLRSATAGQLDTSKPNFDQFTWNDVGNSDVPLASASVISALNRTTGEIDTFAPNNGRPVLSVGLQPAPALDSATLRSATAVGTSDGALAWIGGHTTVVQQNQPQPVWTTATTAAPTVLSDNDPAQLSNATITAPVAGAVVELDARTGKPAGHFPLAGLTSTGSDTRVFPLGTGFLVGTRTGTVDYQ